jgi:beta-glucosidase
MQAPQDAKIERLIAAMTLPEKLGQLSMSVAADAVTGPARAASLAADIRAGTVGSVLNLFGSARCRQLQRVAVEESRLGVPLIFALDVMHGYRTLFPVTVAEAGLFDEETWESTAREAAAEAASDGISMTFAPMLDIARDPRWGRGVEGAGEDPWVAARLGAAKVRGFQGPDLASPQRVAAVAKHFLGYGAVTAGREYASVDVSERTLLEVHLPPFAAAVQAGVAAVMPGFHDLAGIPMTASRRWLTDELRGRLGFQGVIISDYNAVGELMQHGVAGSPVEAAALALRAGVDIDMTSGAYAAGMPEALARGLVTTSDIDAAVRRVLLLKQGLGLFADPYARGRVRQDSGATARRRAIARQVASRSLVLLTNRNRTLPLAPDAGPLAVLGPLAAAAADMRGPWGAAAGEYDAISLLDALAELPVEVRHAQGVPIDDPDASEIPAALALIPGARTILLCLGESARMSGEAASRAHLGLPPAQVLLATEVLARARELRTAVVVVLFSGRPLTIGALAQEADAVLAAGFPGSEAGPAIVDVLLGRTCPAGRTALTWPREVGQVPLFFAQRPSGRPASASSQPYTSRYLDVPNEPLFAFGHGLTYSRCSCSNLRVSPAACLPGDTLEVRVDVVNEGPRAALETVFVFTRDVLASVTRPLLTLRAAGHIALASGQRETLTLTVPAAALAFLGADLTEVWEPGEVEVMAGPAACQELLLAQRVQLLPPERRVP